LKSFTKFTLRFAAYLLVLGYLAGDLYVFNGPLNRRIQASHPDSPESIAKAKANGVVARVFNHHITRSQLDYAIHERLWLEGRKLADLSPADRKLITYAALGDLIDHQLLRVKTKVNTFELPVSDAEIEERLKRFIGRFESKADLESSMNGMGISDETSLRNRIAARIQQEKYVAMRVDPLVKVSEEEITDFYEANKDSLQFPERIRARHIFMATLGKPSDEVKAILEKALDELNSGKKDFATLAKEISEDHSNKENGGELGWMSKSRLPVDFSEAAFAMGDDKPTLVRTKLGWHILQITGRKPVEARTLEETKAGIIAALTAAKRHQAVNDFRSALRRFEQEKIDIFHDQIGSL
jgi:parvulin-like peptidyl-prolyl isomerase